MAAASTHRKKVRTVQSVRWLLWQEALLNWGIPLLLGGVIAVVAALGALEVVAQTTGLATLGWLLLLLVAFLTFRAALIGTVPFNRWALTLGVSLIWLGITCTQLYFVLFVGQEIATGIIGPERAETAFLLGQTGTVYDLVIAGSFVPLSGAVGSEGGYRLSLEREGQVVQTLNGAFSEHWVRRRLGRRGSTTSLELHNHVLHRVQSAGEGMYQLKFIRIDPQLQPTLQMTLYRDIYPQKTFWVIDALLFLGAYLYEIVQAGREIPLVLVTATTLATLLIFHNLAIPPPSYRHLIGAVMIAGLVGPLGGWTFRLVADAVCRRLGYR